MSAATEVADTILRQIPTWLRMAVGVRRPVALTGDTEGVRFDVRGRGPYTVTVVLDRGMDLYDVTVTTKSRAPREFFAATGMYAEDMVEVLNNIDRGRLSA